MNRNLRVGFLFLGVFGFIWGCYYLFPFRMDDAYITYRYVANLADGYGYVYNPGEWVEGNSNLLWALILTLPYMLGFNLYFASVILGVFCWVSFLVMLFRFIDWAEHDLSPFDQFLVSSALLIPVVSQPVAQLWVISGLETGLYVLTLYAGLITASPYLYLLASLTRPEGIVFLVLMPIVSSRKLGSSYVVSLWTWIGLAIVRYLIYGSFMPWTVTAKMGPLFSSLEGGWAYLIFGIRHHLGVLLLLVGVIGILFIRKQSFRISCIVFILLQLGIVLRSGGDWMPYSRLLVPLLGVLAIGWTYAFLQARKWNGTVFRVVGSILIVGVGVLNLRFFEPVRTWTRHLNQSVIENRKVMQKIKENIPESADRTIALADLGAFGWEARSWYVIDRVGLITPQVSDDRQGLYGSYDPGYVLRQEPTLIQTHLSEDVPTVRKYSRNEIKYLNIDTGDVSLSEYATWGGGEALYSHPGFLTNYKFLLAFQTPGNPVNVFWIRKGVR